jgi:hypothetical protein
MSFKVFYVKNHMRDEPRDNRRDSMKRGDKWNDAGMQIGVQGLPLRRQAVKVKPGSSFTYQFEDGSVEYEEDLEIQPSNLV